MTTAAKPAPPPTCPHCAEPLATSQRGNHCPPPHKPCGWVNCKCQAVVALKPLNHTHGKHDDTPNRGGCKAATSQEK